MDEYFNDDRIAHVKSLRRKYRTKSLGGFDGTLFETAYRACRAEEREHLTKILRTQAKSVDMIQSTLAKVVNKLNKSLGSHSDRVLDAIERLGSSSSNLVSLHALGRELGMTPSQLHAAVTQ